MLTELQEKLQKLHNRPTSYELILSDGSTTYLLRYSRHGKIDILKELCAIAEELKAIVGLDEPSVTWSTKRKEFTFDNSNWFAKWSGRTRREAVIEGEHTFIRDALKGALI